MIAESSGDRLRFQPQVPGLDSRQAQQVLDQFLEPVGLAGDLSRGTGRAPPGSSAAPSTSDSTLDLMTDSGVFSSCDTLATKSCRICSACRTSVVSSSTITAPGIAVAPEARDVHREASLRRALQFEFFAVRSGRGEALLDDLDERQVPRHVGERLA